MHPLLLRTRARIRDATKPIGEAAVGALTIGLLRTTRYFDPIKTANLFGRIAAPDRPLDARARIGRANLTAAFPEKSPEEIETILAGVWDNLGRLGAEFAHLDHVWEHDPAHPENSRIEIEPRTHELFAQLRLDGKPALIFASHLGNWELPAVAAVAHGLDAAILFRRPNSASANRIIEEMRAVKMGTLIPAGRDAPLRLAEALQKGQHVAMLVDQYFTNGVDVTFFGRKTKANPTLARLLRQIECPDPWRPHYPPARPSLSRRTVRGSDRRCATPPDKSTFRERCRRSRRWSRAGFANIRISGCGCIAAGGNGAPPRQSHCEERKRRSDPAVASTCSGLLRFRSQ